MRKRYLLTLLIVLSFGYSIIVIEGKPIDNILITGEVKDIQICQRPDNDVWSYRLDIRLHAKNIGADKAIVSTASGMVDYYKFASDLKSLASKWDIHIGWVTSGPPPDPEVVPVAPDEPFKVVSPGESVEIEILVGAFLKEELKPGQQYVQIVAENWPDYSKNYTAKIKEAWREHGKLWEHSLHSEPISFIIPSTLKEISCP